MKKKIVLLLGLVSIACPFPTVAEWQSLTPMSIPRSEMSATLVDGKVYVPGGLGGLRIFQAYDIATDHWETLGPLPDGRHHLMTVSHKGKVYVFGGGDENWRPTDSAWVYDVNTNRWRLLTTMPEPRYAGAAVALGDFIFVVGGAGPTGKTMRYNPKKDTWKMLESTYQRREHLAAVVIEEKIMVIAGRYRGVGELKSTEIYNVENNQWQKGPVLNIARGGHAAVVHQGKIIVLGGEIIMGKYKKTLADSERLDKLSGHWRKSLNLPLALHGMPVFSTNESIYILGGSEQAGSTVNRGQVFRFNE